MNSDATPPPPPYTPAPGSAAPYGSAELKNAPSAVWSLVLGILSLLCLAFLAGIPAVILGIVAIGKVNASNGMLKGKGMAIAGIIMGVVGSIVWSCVGFSMWKAAEKGGGLVGESMAMGTVTAGIVQYNQQTGQWPNSLEEVKSADGVILMATGSLEKAEAEGRPIVFYHYNFSLDSVPAGLAKSQIPVVSLDGSGVLAGQVTYGTADGEVDVKSSSELQALLDGVAQYRTN